MINWQDQVQNGALSSGTAVPSADPGVQWARYLRTTTGVIYVWTGAAWVEEASGGAAGPGLSDAAPQATGTADAGNGTDASRDDHVHALSNHDHTGDAGDGGTVAYSALTGKPTIPSLGTSPSTQAFGDSAAGGSATDAAKTDHKHGMPANPVTAHEAASDPHPAYALESALGTTFNGYILIRDEKTQNTDGGAFTSGAWRTRDLNTEVVDTGNHASVASNQITLEAGTYRIRASAPSFIVRKNQARLQNITDNTTILLGTSAYSALVSGQDSMDSESIIAGRFTLAAQKVLEIQHQCSLSGSFGSAANFTTEVYTVVELWREA